MTLAEKLKSARENAGYSQSQVAERLNISRQAVSRWENGRAYPDIDNLVVLSEIYKVYKVIIAVCFVINLINVGALIKSFGSVFAEWL
ncbi:MAG: helix-turn-helix domain-containing protein [Bariatricus sp.]